jgi:hypothetical protein
MAGARTGASRLIRHLVRPLPGGYIASRLEKIPTTPDFLIRDMGAGRSSSCSSAAGVAREFEVPASGDTAHG